VPPGAEFGDGRLRGFRWPEPRNSRIIGRGDAIGRGDRWLWTGAYSSNHDGAFARLPDLDVVKWRHLDGARGFLVIVPWDVCGNRVNGHRLKLSQHWQRPELALDLGTIGPLHIRIPHGSVGDPG
jgi:hypothetical protein